MSICFFDHFRRQTSLRQVRFLKRNILFVRNMEDIDVSSIAEQSTAFQDHILFSGVDDLGIAHELVEATCSFAIAHGRRAISSIRVISYLAVAQLREFPLHNMASIIVDFKSVCQDAPGPNAVWNRKAVRLLLENAAYAQTVIVVDDLDSKDFWSSAGISVIQQIEELESGGLDQLIGNHIRAKYLGNYRWKKSLQFAWSVV